MYDSAPLAAGIGAVAMPAARELILKWQATHKFIQAMVTGNAGFRLQSFNQDGHWSEFGPGFLDIGFDEISHLSARLVALAKASLKETEEKLRADHGIDMGA